MKLVKGIYFPDSDTHFENVINDQGHYQKKQFDAVMKYIKPEDRGLFIDVGAHVGLWSMMAIKAGFEQLHCFEPNKENLDCLKNNLTTLEEKIIAAHWHYFGLSDKFETVLIVKDKSDNSGAISVLPSLCDKCGNQILGEKSELRVFDNLGYKYDPDYINKTLIKIDVQGYEAKVVRGMKKFIQEYKPIIIVEQWLNGKEDLEATHYCESLGMKILEKVEKEVILGW